MFTGLVKTVGTIRECERDNEGVRLVIEIAQDDVDAKPGDSIAVNGCCLTAVSITGSHFSAHISPETLRCTTLGQLQQGSPVNLEYALRLQDHLGGHLVSGHVDGIAEVILFEHLGQNHLLTLALPQALMPYIAVKGSLCVDGVSLTVNQVEKNTCQMNIIPHTRNHTNFNTFVPGTKVNIEVDMIARYVERLLSTGGGKPCP